MKGRDAFRSFPRTLQETIPPVVVKQVLPNTRFLLAVGITRKGASGCHRKQSGITTTWFKLKHIIYVLKKSSFYRYSTAFVQPVCLEIEKNDKNQPFVLLSKTDLWYAKVCNTKNWYAILPSGLLPLPLPLLLLSILYLYSGEVLFKSEKLNGESTMNEDRNRDKASRVVQQWD